MKPEMVYVKPSMPRIARTADTEALYAAEEAAKRALKVVRKELTKALNHKPEQMWTIVVPEMLAGLLDNYEDGSAMAAAIGYLEKKGFVVGRKIGAEPLHFRIID